MKPGNLCENYVLQMQQIFRYLHIRQWNRVVMPVTLLAFPDKACQEF